MKQQKQQRSVKIFLFCGRDPWKLQKLLFSNTNPGKKAINFV